MEIVTPTSEFDFKSITLADPQPLAGHAGFYFTQLSTSGAGTSGAGTSGAGTSGAGTSGAGAGTDEMSKSLCLQLPECITKQGLVDIKNAKYLDLMFERDTHDELMHWLETLEYTCQDIIDAKKDLWFQTELTRDDIETMMTQIIRLYQSGKYMLMRVFVDINKGGGQKCVAYDENEIGYDIDALEATNKIIPLVMIEGVKFSSRSFEISLKLVQVMVIGQKDKKSSCLIKRPTGTGVTGTGVTGTSVTGTSVTGQEIQRTLKQPILETKPLTFKHSTVQPPLASKPVANKPLAAQSLSAQHVAVKSPLAVKPSIVPPSVAGKPLASKSLAVKPLIEQPLKKLVQMNRPLVKETSQTDVVQTNVGTPRPIIKKNTVINNLEKKNDIEEITINYEDVSDSIILKNPNEVYYEMYKNARVKAKQCRKNAIEAYLEAKQIKTQYMLDDLDDDTESESEDEIDDENYIVASD